MVIDGKQVAAALKASVAAQVQEWRRNGLRAPQLAVVLVGDDPASRIYVRNKGKACEEVGIGHLTLERPADVPSSEVLALIAALNDDPSVDGILVQLPLPAQIDEDAVIRAIAVDKDVDGFHPDNVAALWQKRPGTVPCTPRGIMKLLEAAGVDPCGKRAVVVGRSRIVGLPTAKLLLDANATVTLCHTRTRDLAAVTRTAEILVVAAGQAGLVSGDMVAEGAVVIDVGMDRDPVTGRLCGDVDFASVAPRAAAITPVPGGVGPMTIACLLDNTLRCYARRAGL